MVNSLYFGLQFGNSLPIELIFFVEFIFEFILELESNFVTNGLAFHISLFIFL
jgi:hypothetical protein